MHAAHTICCRYRYAASDDFSAVLFFCADFRVEKFLCVGKLVIAAEFLVITLLIVIVVTVRSYLFQNCLVQCSILARFCCTTFF